MTSPDARTKVGFIGAGGIARRHVGVLREMPDVSLVAFSDSDLGTAETLAAEFDAGAFSDHEQMFEAHDLDAVYICVPPFAHGAPEDAAIARKIPFFVEKPLAVDLDTAIRIAGAVADAGLVTAVGYHWRYLDIVDEAKRLLSDNPAQIVAGHWLGDTPPPAWWWHKNRSGGQIVEQATHIVDLARYLVGEIAEVHAVTADPPRRDAFPGLDVATSTAVSLTFASGAVGTLTVTCMLRWAHRVGLHLFADGLAIELSDRELMVDVGHGRPVRHAGFDPVWAEDRAFINAVRGMPSDIRSPYAEAVKSHRVAMAIARSAEEKTPIRIPADEQTIEC